MHCRLGPHLCAELAKNIGALLRAFTVIMELTSFSEFVNTIYVGLFSYNILASACAEVIHDAKHSAFSVKCWHLILNTPMSFAPKSLSCKNYKIDFCLHHSIEFYPITFKV